MKNILYSVIKHPLIFSSFIAFTGSFIASILTYFFNLFMVRMLPVNEYGLLTALTSMTVLFSVFQISLTGIFAKYSAKYSTLKDEEGFSMLLRSGPRFILIFAISIILIFLLVTPVLSQLLKIHQSFLITIMSVSIATSLAFSFPLGILQGELKFYTISLLNILSASLKLIFGVGAVMLGLGLTGILLGLVLSAIIPVLTGIYIINRKNKKKSKKYINMEIFIQELKKYSLHFLLATLGITILSNADILLVRAFFSPILSGQYAALSLTGKSIFYLTSPLTFVFFPMIAQKRERKESTHSTLLLTVSIIAGITGLISFFYFLYPYFVLQIFAPGEQYKNLASLIGPFSLFMCVFSVANVFNNFFLSIGKTEIYKFNCVAALILVIGIIVFHKSLLEIVIVLLGVSVFLLVGYLICYYYLHYGKN